MLFFGFHMLLGRTPEKRIFANYLLSRRLMGTALLILAANYSVHLIYGIRLKDLYATILMNLSTYFLCYWLFSSAMMTLLNNQYFTLRRFMVHISMWLVFSALALAVSMLSPTPTILSLGMIILTIWLVIYGLFLSVRLLRTYSRAIKMFDNTHSDDIGAYIRWLSIFTYWAIGYGVSCGLLTFLPNKYVFLWILSSIPFYIYLYCSYQNYILFYERVENALQEEQETVSHIDSSEEIIDSVEDSPAYHSDIENRLKEWIDNKGYLRQGISLNDLSMLFCTNRTYLSQFINNVYHKTFRDWITDLRIEYAKDLMKRQPQLMILEVSESSGFVSKSHFTRTFKAKEGCTPSQWRDKLQ